MSRNRSGRLHRDSFSSGRPSEPHVLHAQALLNAGLLEPGTRWTLDWSNSWYEDSPVSGETHVGQIAITYRDRAETGAWNTVGAIVDVNVTPTPGGKRRAWFRCPGCNRNDEGHFVDRLEAGANGVLCPDCCRRNRLSILSAESATA